MEDGRRKVEACVAGSGEGQRRLERAEERASSALERVAERSASIGVPFPQRQRFKFASRSTHAQPSQSQPDETAARRARHGNEAATGNTTGAQPSGSTVGSPPGADETGEGAEQSEDAPGNPPEPKSSSSSTKVPEAPTESSGAKTRKERFDDEERLAAEREQEMPDEMLSWEGITGTVYVPPSASPPSPEGAGGRVVETMDQWGPYTGMRMAPPTTALTRARSATRRLNREASSAIILETRTA